MKTLLKNARILKMDDTPLFNGNIVIENDRIIYIGEDIEKYQPFDIVRECNGNVIMPGFKNAHTHNAMTFLRSKTDDAQLQHWLFDIVFPREAKLRPSDIGPLAKPAYLECLTSGITACLDQYFYPRESAKAAEEIGMRLVIQTIIPDGEDPRSIIIDDYKYFNSKKDSLVTCQIGMHAEYTANDQKFAMVKSIVDELKTPYYIHISETKREVDECIQNRGMSPVEYIDSLGLFNYGGACYHCVWFSDKDIEIFKKRNLIAVTCPGSNTKLSSGVAPIQKYLDAGMTIAIGTDGPASNNCLDMFKEMHLVSSLTKVTTGDPSAAGAYNILKMATVNGAKAMRLDDCDILEVNKKADLIEIDLSRPSMQPLNSIVNNIVYSGSKDIVKMTMINGKILYDQGKFYVGESIEDIYKKAQEITDRIDSEM